MVHRVIADNDEGLWLVAVLIAGALIFFALVSRFESGREAQTTARAPQSQRF
jgi:hypothetical protein